MKEKNGQPKKIAVILKFTLQRIETNVQIVHFKLWKKNWCNV